MRISERVYALLLHLYPLGFRLEYGDAMREAFREAAGDTRRSPLSFWLLIAGDLCRSASLEHRRAMAPGMIYFTRCTVAFLCAMSILAGSSAIAMVMFGKPTAPLNQDLHIADLRTGWSVARNGRGRNKLVPSITLTLQNVSNARVGTVHLNAIFWRIGDDSDWGVTYVPGIRHLEPHGDPAPVTIRSPLGYTGTAPSPALLHEQGFVDVRVKVFAREGGSATWHTLGEWPVQRALVAQ